MTAPRIEEVVAAAGWTVRPAVDTDAEGLVALVGGVFAEYPGCVLDPDDLDADLFAWHTHLTALDGTGWVVLDADATVVGCVGGTPRGGGGTPRGGGGTPRGGGGTPRGGGVDSVELKRLYVAARARRRGLGVALVRTVERWAVARGAAEVVLWSDTRFTDAHRLYERLGYARTGRSRLLHDPSDTTEDEFARRLEG